MIDIIAATPDTVDSLMKLDLLKLMLKLDQWVKNKKKG
jgi:ribosomal protein S10